MPASFLDTNVLVYLASADAEKAGRAEVLLASDEPVISVQVLGELVRVLRRKIGFSWAETRDFLAVVRELAVVRPVTVEIHDHALRLAERHGLSIFDATIVASALEAGCRTLWTEDLQDGRAFESRLRIRNPFRGAGAAT